MRNVILMLLVVLVSTACQDAHTSKRTQFLSVIIDRTGIPVQPEASYVLKYLYQGELFDGIAISLTEITDTQYNPQWNFQLEAESSGLLSNEDQRRKRVRLLKKKFSDRLVRSNEKTYDYQRSAILNVVAKELKHLANTSEKGRILLFSDLREHSSLLSTYHSKTLLQLLRNPKVIQEYLEKQLALPKDLSGIELHLLYQPSLEEAELFSDLVKLYRLMLEPKGVKIIVGYQHTITI